MDILKQNTSLNRGNIMWMSLLIINVFLCVGGSIFIFISLNNISYHRTNDYIRFKITSTQAKEDLLYDFIIEEQKYRLDYYLTKVSNKTTGTLIKQKQIFNHDVSLNVLTTEINNSYLIFKVNDFLEYQYILSYNIFDGLLILSKGGYYYYYLQV